jgi:uncharacterized protein YjbI with pentapeptide repeats
MFVGMDITQANFSHADLTKCDFSETRGEAALFLKANMAKTKFRGAFLQQTFFGGSKVAGCDFSNANLNMAIFTESDCRHVDFRGVDLSYADMSNADLSGADLSGANLNMAKLHGIKEETTVWTGADKKKARGTDKDLAEAQTWQPGDVDRLYPPK